MRTINTTVKFHNAFSLSGLDGVQPPGRYAVSADEEEIIGLNSIGWRRTGTSIRLPAIDVDSGMQQVHMVSPVDLEHALTRDLLLSSKTGER
jgi:hypothetical protein